MSTKWLPETLTVVAQTGLQTSKSKCHLRKLDRSLHLCTCLREGSVRGTCLDRKSCFTANLSTHKHKKTKSTKFSRKQMYQLTKIVQLQHSISECRPVSWTSPASLLSPQSLSNHQRSGASKNFRKRSQRQTLMKMR